MERKTKKYLCFGKQKRWYNQYYFVYTALFAVTFFLCFYWFFRVGKSFIWNPDGLSIHYNFLAYIGEYLRTFFSNLLHGRFRLPMWDYSLGYGSDILTSNFPRVGDPLNYLAVFFSKENTELLHNGLAVLRIYLAGIAFSVYCFQHDKDSYPTLIGALMYAFCGVVLWAGVRHSYFIVPMIYFPLLVLGAERLLYENRPFLFSFMIFASAVGSFYFFYMMSILVFVFTVVTFFTDHHESIIKEFFQKLGIFILYYAIGFLLSAFMFVPIAFGYMGNARLNAGSTEPLLFRRLTYYLEFIPRWISQGSEYGEATGYIPLALIFVVALFFIKKKELKRIKVLFVVLTTFLLIPLFGYIFNGFSYVIDRWVFGYSFLIAFIAVNVLPYLKILQGNQKLKQIIYAICVILGLGCTFVQNLSTATFYSGVLLLAISAVTIFWLFPTLEKKNEKLIPVVLLGLVVVSLAINGDFRFSPLKENYISEYIDSGDAYDKLQTSSASAVESLEDYSIYRIDEEDSTKNTSVAQGYSGVQFYTSLLDYRIDEFHKLLAVNNAPAAQVYNFKGLDRRACIEALLGVKYYTTKTGDTDIPYGFEERTTQDDNVVYENENVLPFAYTYDSYITREEFEGYSIEQRQEALLQSVVLDEAPEDSDVVSGTDSVQFLSENIPYTVVTGDGIEIDGNTITVTKENAVLRLNFEGIADSETYIKLENLDAKPLTKEQRKAVEEEKNYSAYRKYVTENKTDWDGDTTSIRIRVNRKGGALAYRFRNENDRLYGEINDFFMNLGYSEEPRTWCSISFNVTGVYTFDDLSIVCQPMNHLQDLVQERRSEEVSNLAVISNTIACDVNLEEDKVLYFPIPFNEGWTATVDGEEANLTSGNVFGMALALKTGSHNVVIRYRTPGLKLGIMISAATAVCVGLFVFIRKMWRKKKKAEK